jgi:hypothetical protein
LRPQATLVEDGETLTGIVTDIVFRGQGFRIELKSGLHFLLPTSPQPGQEIRLKVHKVEML